MVGVSASMRRVDGTAVGLLLVAGVLFLNVLGCRSSTGPGVEGRYALQPKVTAGGTIVGGFLELRPDGSYTWTITYRDPVDGVQTERTFVENGSYRWSPTSVMLTSDDGLHEMTLAILDGGAVLRTTASRRRGAGLDILTVYEFRRLPGGSQ